MKSDVLAPIVKTLFIPEGNPGIHRVKEIRAIPHISNAGGDSQEITVTGEMDINISYLPIDGPDKIPWEMIHSDEGQELEDNDSRNQVLSRLESALKDDEDDQDEDKYLKVDLSVPFTLAIGTEDFCQDHVLKLEPSVYSTNWFLVSPKAIEFEAVLKLISEEKVLPKDSGQERQSEIGFGIEKPAQEEEISAFPSDRWEKIEKPPEVLEETTKPSTMPEKEKITEQSGSLETEKEVTEPSKIMNKEENIKEKTEILEKKEKAAEQAEVFPKVLDQDLQMKQSSEAGSKSEVSDMNQTFHNQFQSPAQILFKKLGHKRHLISSQKFYQMKFYRVQMGEDMDAVADKLGVSKESIQTLNSINEEEIKTGLLLSIPRI